MKSYLLLSVLLTITAFAREPRHNNVPMQPPVQNGAALPSRVDNSKSEFIPPVIMQAGGSCAQANGIGYVFSYEINRLRGIKPVGDENLYAYTFIYNFLNAGTNDTGSIPEDGWDIVKALGVPRLKDFKESGTATASTWMSGYDLYYHAMCNRISSRFVLQVQTGEGLTLMKQYLYDHMEGSAEGGLLCLSIGAEGLLVGKLAAGTPDAGKTVITAIGGGKGHALTIVGYDDSIQYDIDNNGAVSEAEKGAVIILNSWGELWGDRGKAYMMYHHLQDPATGIRNNAVNGIRIKPDIVDYTPSLTFRISMTHSNRSLLSIRTASSDTASNSPTRTLSTGLAFNFSGGPYPLDAGESDPFEFGLDITSLIPGNGTAAYYLLIESNGGTGMLHSCALVDYGTSVPVEYPLSEHDKPIIEGITSLRIVHTSQPTVIFSRQDKTGVKHATVQQRTVAFSSGSGIYEGTGNEVFFLNGRRIVRGEKNNRNRASSAGNIYLVRPRKLP